MKIIAISGRSVDYKSATGLEKRRLYVNGYFSDVAEGAGFILFPVCSQNGIEEIAAMCSGLIIAGRDRDIHPKYYGKEPDENIEYPEDDYEDDYDSDESIDVYDAAEIWFSNGMDEDYTFGYSEEELRRALED